MNKKLAAIKDKKVAILCPTYEEAKQLMSVFAHNSIQWRLGVSAEEKTNWEKHTYSTCYNLDYVGISYSSRDWYEKEGYKVILFSEFMPMQDILQDSLSALWNQSLKVLTDKVQAYARNQIKVTDEVVFQYYSENNKDIIDTVDVGTGTVVVRNNDIPRHIKLKDLSVQDLINVIGCVEKKQFV